MTSESSKAINNASKRANEGLSKQAWERIEKPLSEQQLNVIKANVAYAKNKIVGSVFAPIVVATKRVIGDDLYIESQKILHEYGIISNLTEIQEPKKKKVSMKTADKIRSENTQKTLKNEITDVCKSYDWKTMTPQLGLRSNYIEIVGTAFMYLAKFILKKREFYSTDKNIPTVWSIMVSMQRYIESMSNYIGIDPINPSIKSSISEIFIKDMNNSYDEINAVFQFDGETICKKASDLLVYSPYDEFIPSKSIQPRDHQKRVVDIMHEKLKNLQPVVINYNSMIGSGKTTTVCAALEIAKHHKKVLLCVCNLETVREQMCNNFLNAGQNFASAATHYDGTSIKLSQTWSKSKGDINAIVCGPDIAYQILTGKLDKITHVAAKQKYVLFHDEYTIGGHDINSDALKDNIKVLLHKPDISILSSATAPPTEFLSTCIDRCNFETVYSPTVFVSCEVRTENGELFIPFKNCRNTEDLMKVIDRIKNMPFLGRTLSGNVALHIYQKLIEYNIRNIPNIPEMFKKVSNMIPDKIRETIISMLEILAIQGTPEIITSICNFDTTDTTKSVDFKKLGTGVLWKGMTLVVDTDPVEFMKDNFKSLLDELEKYGIKSATKLIEKYKDEYAKWKTNMDRSLSHLEASANEKAMKNSEFLEKKPKIDLPEWAHVGSAEYCKRFLNSTDKMNIVDIRSYNSPEVIADYMIMQEKKKPVPFIDATNVSDSILLLLLCGVASYSPTHKSLDDYYNDIVMEYSNNGKLAYLISDISIVFGTNQPFGRVMLTDRFTKVHSVEVLFQAMARAGRVGKLAKAEAIISTDTMNMLLDYTIHPELYDIETRNMAIMITKLKNEKQEDLDSEIARLESEIKDDVKTEFFNFDNLETNRNEPNIVTKKVVRVKDEKKEQDKKEQDKKEQDKKEQDKKKQDKKEQDCESWEDLI